MKGVERRDGWMDERVGMETLKEREEPQQTEAERKRKDEKES